VLAVVVVVVVGFYWYCTLDIVFSDKDMICFLCEIKIMLNC